MALAFALPVPPVLAQGTQARTLARAAAVWSAADRDRDGRIVRAEAASIPLDEEGFRQADLDGDGVWSREEFLRFYRQRVVASAERVGADLDAEIVRLRALKRAQAIEDARRCASGHPLGTADPAIAAAFAELERRLSERRARREDAARLRRLIHATITDPPRTRCSVDGDAILDRIEQAAGRGVDAPADRSDLRQFLVRHGWIAPAASPTRTDRRATERARSLVRRKK